jgi:hypothetical protein
MFAEEFLPIYGVSGEVATEPQVWEALLSGLMRTATTDERARRWFRRYWSFGVGSGAHILVHALLEMIRQTAEHARTTEAEQAR